MHQICAIPCVILGTATLAAADTVHVPDDTPSIDTAIALAGDGGAVLIAPGTYPADDIAMTFGVNIIGTMDTDGAPLVTITPGSGGGRMFTVTGTNATPHVRNLRLTDGSAQSGGAMLIDAGMPTIENCIFSNNSVTSTGGAIVSDPYCNTGETSPKHTPAARLATWSWTVSARPAC